MAVTKIKPIKSTLSKALDYIENPDKTDGKMLVSSFGCSYETADIEFGYTLSQALDKGNNLAFHLIQSFEPGEVDYQKAHEIGKQLADAVTKGQHEYVVTTHIDKGHIHNHIIFCAVNFVDHHKYNSNKRSYYGIRNMSDKLCRENGLSVVVPGKGSKGKSYAEYQAEKTGTSWKGKLSLRHRVQKKETYRSITNDSLDTAEVRMESPRSIPSKRLQSKGSTKDFSPVTALPR